MSSLLYILETVLSTVLCKVGTRSSGQYHIRYPNLLTSPIQSVRCDQLCQSYCTNGSDPFYLLCVFFNCRLRQSDHINSAFWTIAAIMKLAIASLLVGSTAAWSSLNMKAGTQNDCTSTMNQDMNSVDSSYLDHGSTCESCSSPKSTPPIFLGDQKS